MPLSRALQLGLKRRKFLSPADERRVSQLATAVVPAHHDRRLRDASVERLGDLVEVGQGRFRRLVAVSRVPAQEPLSGLVQGTRRPDPDVAEHGGLHRQVLPQNLAEAVAREQGSTRQALEQYGPDRVQVGALVHFEVEQARLLGRHVARRRDEPVAPRGDQPCRSRQAKVGEHGPPERFFRVDDDVGGLDFAVQLAEPVHLAQAGQNAAADDEGFRDRQRPLGQSFLKRHAGDVRSDEEQPIVLAPELSPARDPGPQDATQRLGDVLELLDSTRRSPLGRHRLDHHSIAMRPVDRQQRLQPRIRLQPLHDPVAAADDSLSLRWLDPQIGAPKSIFHRIVQPRDILLGGVVMAHPSIARVKERDRVHFTQSHPDQPCATG